MVLERLKTFREAAKLSEAELGQLLGWEASTVAALEHGEAPVTPEALEVYARVAGVEVMSFLSGDSAQNAPPALFFRGLLERELSLEELANADLPLLLGDLVRATRRLAQVRAQLGATPALPWQAAAERAAASWGLDATEPSALFRSARLAADWLRAWAGLGEQPIPSMHSWLAELGVATFYQRVEAPVLDGIALLSPTPAILILLDDRASAWRTRMTLAHELGHLLFDLPRRERQGETPLMLSPIPTQVRGASRLRPGWSLVPEHEALEQRANAFAAALLAPERAVRRLLDGANPTQTESVAAVGERFGLGWVASVNVLTNAFNLSTHQRRRMIEAQGTLAWEGRFEADAHPPLGLYGGELRERVMQALQQQHINPTQARSLLNLTLADPLPGEDTAPWTTHEALQRLVYTEACQRWGPGYCGGAVRTLPHGWEVDLLYTPPRARKALRVGVAQIDDARVVTLPLERA